MNEAQDERLPRLVHELRSPLNATLTWVTLLRAQKGDSSLMERGLEAIERSTRLQAAIVDKAARSTNDSRVTFGRSEAIPSRDGSDDPITIATRAAVDRFNDAFNRHDVAAIMDAMTEDCVFDSTRPPPDGERIVGSAAVRKYWEEFFERSPNANIDQEEIVAAGDRCVVRWVYRWVREGKAGHVRGIDLFRIRDGKVAEKHSYVKG